MGVVTIPLSYHKSVDANVLQRKMDFKDGYYRKVARLAAVNG
jgi:hypothetical protein